MVSGVFSVTERVTPAPSVVTMARVTAFAPFALMARANAVKSITCTDWVFVDVNESIAALPYTAERRTPEE